MTDLFTVTRFDRQGRLVDTSPAGTRKAPRPGGRVGSPPGMTPAIRRAHNGGGGTYIHLDGTELKFKPYRQTDPFSGLRRTYLSPGRKHMSNAGIIAAAKRFEADGEMDNAVNMLGLLK